MENLGMFLKSLLVLAVVIQTLEACSCQPRTAEQAMCDADTVLVAIVHEDKNNPIYEMFLDEVFKNGSNPLSWSEDDRMFKILVTMHESDCGVVLIQDMIYYLSGVVNTEGVLEVNKCELIKHLPWDETFTEESEAIDDLLTGKRPLNCGGV